jgi:uncharacterized protein with HEPN domain
MQLEVKKCLFDILEAARGIEDYTRGLDYADYRDNGMLQAAVERKFEIIGEALNRIKKADSAVLAEISQYERIISFRNVISHGYDAVDLDIVWNAVQHHLPTLRREVQSLLSA